MDSLLEVISPKFRNDFLKKAPKKRQFIQTFDFRRRNQLSKETRISLERIHESFAKEIAIYLNNKLRSNVQFKLNTIKQYSIEEFYEILNNPTSLYLINIISQKRNVVFELRQDFSFYILDRLLGGPGSTNFENRELTRIELKVIESIIKNFLKTLSATWKNTFEFDAEIQSHYNNGDYLQFVRRGDSVVTMAYQVSINEKIHLNNAFNITYPFLLIEEMIPVVKVDSKKSPQKASEKEKLFIQDNLSAIKAPLIVDLGTSSLSVREIVKLQVGDIIMLDKCSNDNLSLKIGKNHFFEGRAGMLKNKMAFRITHKR